MCVPRPTAYLLHGRSPACGGRFGEDVAGKEGVGAVIHIDVHQEKGERFKVLRTTDRTQLAMMTLPPGGTTSNEEGLTDSDQVIYVVEGRIELTVGDEKRELRAGEVAVIPAATAHRLRVLGRRSATMLNVYGPPAYPPESGAEVRSGETTRAGAGSWSSGYGASGGYGGGGYDGGGGGGAP